LPTGIDLVGYSAATSYIPTGFILLAAVTLDASPADGSQDQDAQLRIEGFRGEGCDSDSRRTGRACDSQAVRESLSIPRRFNGPLESGNGGYCSGIVASFLEGAAEVSLRRPVPLDTPLEVVRESDGSVRVLHGETTVAEARSAPELNVEVPAPVSPVEARLATAGYTGQVDGPFSRCFVCGRARKDALGVFAGAVEGRQLVASLWTPASWTADAEGRVLPEFVWAVLDCPTYFASYSSGTSPISVLARLTARVDAPVVAGEEHVVVAWPMETDGRKRHAGSAVLSSQGETLAVAHALLIEPRH
jgi:hypothetical protein